MGKSQRRAFTEAAVAIPFCLREQDEPEVLITRRPATMAHHPGELCFPGGKRECSDSSLQATAWRELQEELGVARTSLRGYRAEAGCVTTSGFHIEPFVVTLGPDTVMRPDKREIDSYCLIALSELLVLDRYRIEKFSRSRDEFGFTYPTKIGPIRGASCSLLLNVVKAIFRAGGPTAYLATLITMHSPDHGM